MFMRGITKVIKQVSTQGDSFIKAQTHEVIFI